MILEEHPEAAADRSLKILEAGQIEEEDFFLPCDTQNMGRHSPRYTESP